ncbi:MAG: L-threonylcarbamoyladenylate synthase [Rhabdochlamydiaceae bacterium]
MRTKVLIESELDQAVSLLKEGKVVAFPTETVYGLGAVLSNQEAVQKIFSLKKRPQDNPLIVHIADVEDVYHIAKEIPKEFFFLAEKFFPGPLTIILPKSNFVSDLVSAGSDTVAFRMPNHPMALELIRKVEEPLVAPSANLSGKPSGTRVSHIMHDFSGSLDAVLDGGECSIGIESTVLNLCHPKEPIILRPGAVGHKELEDVLGCKVRLYDAKVCDEKNLILSPGLKYRHYAPKTSLFLFDKFQELEAYLIKNRTKKLLLLVDDLRDIKIDQMIFSEHNLYDVLRQTDHQDYDEILVFCSPNLQKKVALMNRLLKAAGVL